ncbi:MAG: hypothetical protein RIR69_1389 [Actinomycetota bacterium]|jgi:methionyl-tRNA formyltransferase
MTQEGRPLVFLGTPDAAAVVLEALIAENFSIAHVITRHDARRGRGGATSPSPVKKVAHAHGIDVSHDLAWLEDNHDKGCLGIVVAYGKIIPASMLAHTPMINLHFSLLPRWRGAAPVERAILAGDTTTGVCIMDLEETLDTGPVHCCAEVPISASHTTATLTDELSRRGAQLLTDLLNRGLSDVTPQHGEATYAHKISSEELRLDWTADAVDIDRKVRALRSYTSLDQRRIRILDVAIADDGKLRAPGQCGTDGVVGTGNGAIRLVRVQPEGKNPMNATDWLRGRANRVFQFDSIG